MRLTIAFFSDVIFYILFGVVAIAFLIVNFGASVVSFAGRMMLAGNFSHANFSIAYPGSSSLLISISLIFTAIVYLAVFLAAFKLIVHCFDLFLLFRPMQYFGMMSSYTAAIGYGY